ncbi:hypothetical protein TgHK011_000104 [Trichoderma gracile]|nr:hypothetical protein TgHK011_000104 [Trichoderma gracile]
MDLLLLPSMPLGRAGIASDMPPAQITTPRLCLFSTKASNITRISPNRETAADPGESSDARGLDGVMTRKRGRKRAEKATGRPQLGRLATRVARGRCVISLQGRQGGITAWLGLVSGVCQLGRFWIRGQGVCDGAACDPIDWFASSRGHRKAHRRRTHLYNSFVTLTPVANDPTPTQRADPVPALSLLRPLGSAPGAPPGGNSSSPLQSPAGARLVSSWCCAVLGLCLHRSQGLDVCNHTLPWTVSQRCMSVAAAMETPAASSLVRSPGVSALSNESSRGPPKRKRTSESDSASNNDTSASRPRGYDDYVSSFQLASPGRADAAYTHTHAHASTLSSPTGSALAATRATPPAAVAVLPGPGHVPVHVPVAGLQSQPQAYHDYQLHSTGSGPSGHSRGQDGCAEPVYGHDNAAMPIAGAVAPTAYSPRSTAVPPASPYNQQYQQAPWFVLGPSGDAVAQSHFQPVPSNTPPQAVPLQSIHMNGPVFPPPFNTVSPHQLSLPGQENVIPADANLGTPYPSVQAFQPHVFGLSQHLVSGEAVTLSDNRPPLGYPPPPPGQLTMGGGPQYPESRQQAPADGYLAQQPTVSVPSASMTPGSAVSPSHTGSGKAIGELDAQGQDSPSYGQPMNLTENNEHDTERQRREGSTIVCDFGLPDGGETADAMDADADPDADADVDADADADADAEVGADVAADVAADADVDIDADADADIDVDADPNAHDASPAGEVEQESSSIVVVEDPASPTTSNKPRRSPLSPNQREQAAMTRKIKACTRCRMQKMRCDPDPKDPMGACVGCQTFSRTSKKTIHRMPCYRGKGTEMKDIMDRINPKDIRTIKFTLGICKEPITVEVVAFQPQSGDVTARFWMVPDGELGVRKKKDLAHYCLASIHKTATYFEEYIKEHAVDVMKMERAGGKFDPRDVLERTYDYIIKRYQDLSSRFAVTGNEERELKFLGNMIILWFAMRHSTGSSWLLGEELLGMKPETRDDTYPLFGKVSVPRMILAQFDSINHTKLLSKYGKLVLSELESLMSRSQPQHFFLVYACMFMLLREASWISEDRYRHARNNLGRSLRYSIPAFVESLHESCNNLLQHWHYFNCKTWPLANEKAERYKGPLAGMSSTEFDLLMQARTDRAVQGQLDVWRRYKADNGHVTKPAPNDVGGRPYEGRQVFYDWDHPFYWVSQLFEEDWHPHATYQREYIE